MKYSLLFLLTLFCATDASIPELHPKLGDLVTKCPEGARQAMITHYLVCPAVVEAVDCSECLPQI